MGANQASAAGAAIREKGVLSGKRIERAETGRALREKGKKWLSGKHGQAFIDEHELGAWVKPADGQKLLVVPTPNSAGAPPGPAPKAADPVPPADPASPDPGAPKN